MRMPVWILLAIMQIAGASLAPAQDWPHRAVKIVVPFPAGGAADLIAREIAQGLNARFGQPFVVENRGGAGSTTGTAAAASAPGDGYTFLVTSSHYAIVPSLYAKLPYDPLKDMTGVSLLVNIPVVLVVNPALPVNSVKELIEYERKNPGKLNFSSSGTGGIAHLSGELFNSLASTKMTHIPYKGAAPAMTDLVAGHVQVMFDAISTSLPNIKAGYIKPIAWTGPKASPILPGLPTIAGSGLSDYSTSSWLAMYAPANTPPDIIEKVSSEVRVILSRPEVKERQLSQGVEIVASMPAELNATTRSEVARWSEFVKKVGIQPE